MSSQVQILINELLRARIIQTEYEGLDENKIKRIYMEETGTPLDIEVKVYYSKEIDFHQAMFYALSSKNLTDEIRQHQALLEGILLETISVAYRTSDYYARGEDVGNKMVNFIKTPDGNSTQYHSRKLFFSN